MAWKTWERNDKSFDLCTLFIINTFFFFSSSLVSFHSARGEMRSRKKEERNKKLFTYTIPKAFPLVFIQKHDKAANWSTSEKKRSKNNAKKTKLKMARSFFLWSCNEKWIKNPLKLYHSGLGYWHIPCVSYVEQSLI